MNLFLKDSALRGLPEGSALPNFQLSDAFSDVPPSPTSSTRAFLDMADNLDSFIELYSNYTPYSSIIPEPYLTYMQSLVLDNFFHDYVAFVTQETSGSYYTTVYNIAFGDLIYTGSSISATGSVTLYKMYTSNRFPQYRVSTDSSFSLSLGSSLVYTNLESPYPNFALPVLSGWYVLFALFFGFVMFCFARFFYVRFFKLRRR